MTATLSRRAALGAAILPALAAPGFAQSSEWRPSRPIRIVVPTAAGGANDVLARIFGNYISPRLGQPVVVDAKGGAGGTIGTMDALRSAPDGHTVLMGNIGAQSIAYSLARNMPYTPDDLVPISNMFLSDHVLVIHPSLRATTVPELVAQLRENPDRYSYGSPGIGSSPHLAAVWFNQAAGTRSTPVHYRGSAPAGIDFLAGTTQIYFDVLSNQLESIRAGRVRALAVTGRSRNPLMPELPTMIGTMPEFANFTTGTWIGLLAPRGTPAAAIRTLNLEMKALLDSEDGKARIAAMGGIPDYGTPEQFGTFVRGEIDKWSAVIRREGLQVDLT